MNHQISSCYLAQAALDPTALIPPPLQPVVARHFPSHPRAAALVLHRLKPPPLRPALPSATWLCANSCRPLPPADEAPCPTFPTFPPTPHRRVPLAPPQCDEVADPRLSSRADPFAVEGGLFLCV